MSRCPILKADVWLQDLCVGVLNGRAVVRLPGAEMLFRLATCGPRLHATDLRRGMRGVGRQWCSAEERRLVGCVVALPLDAAVVLGLASWRPWVLAAVLPHCLDRC